jgi:hypothetical protein
MVHDVHIDVTSVYGRENRQKKCVEYFMFRNVQSVVVILCRVYSNLHSCRAPRS